MHPFSSGGIADIISQANAAAEGAYLAVAPPQASRPSALLRNFEVQGAGTNMLAQEKAYLSSVDHVVQKEQKEQTKTAYMVTLAKALDLKAPATAQHIALSRPFVDAMPAVKGLAGGNSKTAMVKARGEAAAAAAASRMALATEGMPKRKVRGGGSGGIERGEERDGSASQRWHGGESEAKEGMGLGSRRKTVTKGILGSTKAISPAPAIEAEPASSSPPTVSVASMGAGGKGGGAHFHLRKDVGDRGRVHMLAALKSAMTKSLSLQHGREEVYL